MIDDVHFFCVKLFFLELDANVIGFFFRCIGRDIFSILYLPCNGGPVIHSYSISETRDARPHMESIRYISSLL
jgi:hypothetical protein